MLEKEGGWPALRPLRAGNLLKWEAFIRTKIRSEGTERVQVAWDIVQ